MVRRLLAGVFLAAFPIVVIPIAATSIAAPAGAASPAAVQQCKNGGWKALTDASGQPFKNQGQCVAHAIHHPVSLADLASLSPFTGMAMFSQPPGCFFAQQTFDAVYPGSTSVGTVTLHIAGCADPFATMRFNSGSFTITTNVGALSGTASGPVTLSGGSLVLFQLTLSVAMGTGSFAGTVGSLHFVTLYPAPAPPTFVGTVTVP
jgi:hypothetical protein